jgi:hypothetical protein
MSATDGHFPFGTTIEGNNGTQITVIGCECGWKPVKRSERSSMQHVSHMAHRRKLGLRPVEYWWSDEHYMEGLSRGGYMVMRNADWVEGKGWVRK